MGRNNKAKLNKVQRLENLRAKAQKMRIRKKKSIAADDDNSESQSLPSLINLYNRQQSILTSQSSIGIKRKHDCNTTNPSSNLNQTVQPLPYKIDLVENEFKTADISGHRVVELNYFFNELVKMSSHPSMFKCGLPSMKFESEKLCGLTSVFTFSCSMCAKKFKVQNSTQNLNQMAVAGMMAAGCGNAQLNEFSVALDLPSMSEYRYNIVQDEVCDEWEVTAWEEMRKAGEREKEAAIEEGKVTKDGIPIIDVILDGCWSKRSYKTNYAALSGAATIIGRRFHKVLFMAVKNKYCCICARAEKQNKVVKQHECFKNYSGSSTAMESTIIAEGFRQSLEMHGIIYGRYIADGDSSTYAKILDTRPYPSITVEKISCKNHILRNFCNKLQILKTDTRYCLKERNILTTNTILKIRKYICDAIKYHGSQTLNQSDNIKNLHGDVSNAINHAIERHDSCNKHFCNQKSTGETNHLCNTRLWHQIKYLICNVASHSRSLIENVDSNIVENFNSVVAKFVGGKRVNYALKRSYQARCAGAVVSFNSGKILTTVHKTIHNTNPLPKIKKYEEQVQNTRTYNQTIKRKKNRKLFFKKTDLNYGENSDKPDLDPETFNLTKFTFLKNLEKSDEERKQIQERTILQSESGEWLELRRNLLTASNFGKVVKRIKTNSCANMVKNMLYRANIDHVASISHGKKFEKKAIEQLSSLENIEIQQCGLFIDKKYPFLGATPDGIAGDMLIEIKCPIAPYKIGIDTAIQEGKMHFWRYNKKTGQVNVNEKSDWFIQVQGQMHICQFEKCLVAVWYGDNKIKTELVFKENHYWDTIMEPKLLSFYFDCLLPELVDPRYTRNRPIRDPDYLIPKKSKKKYDEEKTTNTKIAEERIGRISEKTIIETLELNHSTNKIIMCERELDFDAF